MKYAPQQGSLFGEPGKAGDAQCLIRADGDVRLYRHWWTQDLAADLFERLYDELDWQQTVIRMHGRRLPVPRLDVWYGDPGRDYRYSGVQFRALPWSPTLKSLKDEIEQALGQRFNSALANLYRSGRDSVAWHSDDEPELGQNPVIASVSLGAERRFSFRHKKRQHSPVHLNLPSGSVLVMSGATQHHWQHQLPKTSRPVGARINLTFRCVG